MKHGQCQAVRNRG